MRMNNLCRSLVLSLLCTPSLFSQRPVLLTESAHTSGKHLVELIGAVEYLEKATAPRSTFPRTLTRAAVIGWHQGVADNVNLDIDWKGYLYATLGNGAKVNDWGDVTLSTRVQFLGERKAIPAIGLRTAVKLPNTKYRPHGLGSNQTDYSSHLLLTKHYGAVEARMNLGFGIIGDPRALDAQDDVYLLSSSVVVRANSWLTLFLELYGVVGYYDDDDKLLARWGTSAHLSGIELILYGSARQAGSNIDIGGAFEASERWSIGIALKKIFELSFLRTDEPVE
jgi:hypothetical protein